MKTKTFTLTINSPLEGFDFTDGIVNQLIQQIDLKLGAWYLEKGWARKNDQGQISLVWQVRTDYENLN